MPKAGAIIVSALGLMVLASIVWIQTGAGQAWLAANAPAADTKPDPLKKVTIASFQPRLDLGIATADFTIANANAFPVRDIIVGCRFQGASGTTINEGAATIFDVVPAKGKKTFKALTLGIASQQTKNVSCSVVDAKLP